MACIWRDSITARICGLVDDVENTGAIGYKIQVESGSDVFWHVIRRYSDFEALHRKLLDSQGIPRDNIVLPPKKLLGNKDPEFVEKRRELLDLYLRNVVVLLGKNPPDDLAHFLNLFEFEIIFMLRRLALEVFEKGDRILESGAPYVLTPYQIFAMNERMKMALPPLESPDKRHDFSHIVDFCSNLTNLELVGSNIPLGKSNIIPNEYSMDLTPFKSLSHLTLKLVNIHNLNEVGPMRRTLEHLSVHNSALQSTNDLLLCDTVYKTVEEAGGGFAWPNLKSLNLANNALKSLDDIGVLTPSLHDLDLTFNQLTQVFKLTSLPYLAHVSYGGNLISSLLDLRLSFGNVKVVELSQNQVEKLDAFSKLYSLVVLNLSCNRVKDVDEIGNLSELPCLEILILSGNPVASSLDYRVRALTYFGSRATDVSLDSEKASMTEVDQISILQAIQLARRTTIPHPHYS